MSKINVAVVVGSNRLASINRKLAWALVKQAAAKPTPAFVQIADLPMYNHDLESPLPAPVARFRAEVERAEVLLFVTPEHNRSIPAALKNAIDWGARPHGQNACAGKPAAIIATSPGTIATAIAQQHLRQILGDLGALVMGGEAYVRFKPELLDADDTVTDAATRSFLQSFLDRFVDRAGRLGGRKADAVAA
jgi:chromate reductase